MFIVFFFYCNQQYFGGGVSHTVYVQYLLIVSSLCNDTNWEESNRAEWLPTCVNIPNTCPHIALSISTLLNKSDICQASPIHP